MTTNQNRYPTVRITGGSEAMVSCKDKEDIPKGKYLTVSALKNVEVTLLRCTSGMCL